MVVVFPLIMVRWILEKIEEGRCRMNFICSQNRFPNWSRDRSARSGFFLGNSFLVNELNSVHTLFGEGVWSSLREVIDYHKGKLGKSLPLWCSRVAMKSRKNRRGYRMNSFVRKIDFQISPEIDRLGPNLFGKFFLVN
jgi:hypothetical protein